ncbi:hypothetical protein AB4K20DRAFT_1997483 [Rhizopus microsporus]|uniref:Uncharacterized protein n=2 Tax=Rhizopus TaxID=4842 RepID=A0A1X0RUJ1_RHIZD|nr:hypothetical protein BCV71DRAFT_245060 [Rhizopus microsporus]
MPDNYFLDTPVDDWSIKTAFTRIEENNPKNIARENLRLLKSHLYEALKSNDYAIIAAATKLLQDWNHNKRELIPKRNKRAPTYNNNNYGNVFIVQPTNSNVVINECAACSSTITPKKHSLAKQRKKRNDADIGRPGSNWEINQLNVSKVLNTFRQVSIQGAQLRKFLSDSRVLSLSYIFLLSSIDNCALSKLAPQDQKLIMKNLNTKEHLKPVDDEVMNACQKIHHVLNDDDIDRDRAEEAVDEIKSSSPNKSVKLALKIISSILFKLVDNHKSNNQTQGEAILIIENIRPFLNHCIISQLEGVKYEW